jgi:hypothetical protein
MVGELAQTSCEVMRRALLDYGGELVEFQDFEALDFHRRVEGSGLFLALKDSADRELLAHAIALGCDAFCTRDRATIISVREKLPKMNLRVLTPREWWLHVRPWGALW